MFRNLELSLADLLGRDYAEAVQRCAVRLLGLGAREAADLAFGQVSFYPEEVQARIEGLLEQVGRQIIEPFPNDNTGAPTAAFAAASNRMAAPLGGLGPFRVGEDGRLYLAAKSEHYHTPLGHGFGGYRLIDRARSLGIPNATHNNTRGTITRHLERELVRCVNGLPAGAEAALQAVLQSEAPQVLNRVINLETGSLAVEAGLKMMLSRFYRLEEQSARPKHEGKTPVFFVMADESGGLAANYHGTTVFAQCLRGLWPEFRASGEAAGLYRVVGVKINHIDDFRSKMEAYNRGEYRVAGFLHEIVLMNYGGIVLEKDYLQQVYSICRQYAVPVLVDEIQSCMWYSGMFLHRLCDLKPDFVILGKGFPGGEYPASKILTTAEMDSLNLFGALVTNGQEELASLAYLITMAYAQANGDEIGRLGGIFQAGLHRFAQMHTDVVSRVEGLGHLAAIHFHTMKAAARFAALLNARCIDVSAQTYKAHCPPAVLFKLPWIVSENVIDFILMEMEKAIEQIDLEGESLDKP